MKLEITKEAKCDKLTTAAVATMHVRWEYYYHVTQLHLSTHKKWQITN